MAVITISRQVAALGDEVASAAAEKLGYTFIDRKQVERRIVELGFPQEKLSKYDERRPGFFASLAKDRDEYLNYLQLAVLEAAAKGNCILIGRGSFVILEELANLLSLRFVSRDDIRMERLKNEFSWNDKQARSRIDESDSNRKGFHKSFFNLESENPQCYHLVLNTSLLSVDESVRVIEGMAKAVITPEKESAGSKRVQELLRGQRLVNQLLYTYKYNVSFLRADVKEDSLVLQGIAESQAVVDRAVQTAAKLLPSCAIQSSISIVTRQ